MLLALIGAQRLMTTRRAPGVERYHQRVRAAAAAAPRRIGGWVGEDVSVPVQAMTLLDPNAIISRRYTNVENGSSAAVLIVHCADAHDMAGHFPLRCYPAQGWVCGKSWPRDWPTGNLIITGTEYEFKRSQGAGQSASEQALVVANCLLRPGGNIFRDMDTMTASIVGAGGQALGAGQIQICFDVSVPEDQREHAIRELMEGFRPVLDAILAPPYR
jgi:hypothetical protein